jgi:hypothetical protein
VADLFDRYAVPASPAAPAAGSDLFDRYVGAPTAGGVQDYEPTIPEPTIMDRVNRGVNWLGTRATKAATGLAGLPRAYADLERMAVTATGLPYAPSPVAAATRFLPSSQQMNETVFNRLGVPEVNASGKGGKILDAATEAALGAVVMPGSLLRNVVPAAVGGASQEVAGQMTEGTKYEPGARVVAGVVAGGLSAAAQNALGNVAQAGKNLRPNVDKTAAKIVGRALERDQMTGETLGRRQADLGPGAMLVEAGGPNVRGTMRGSIAAPGAARTEAQNAFDLRLEGSNARTTQALDSAISPTNSLAMTVDDLATQRAAASRPAYEAAGIPGRRADLPKADRLMLSDDVLTLFKDSPDVQAALRTARKVPELKGEPINSMAVLDRVYKYIGDKEQVAKRAGEGTRAGDLGAIRSRLASAIGEENPAYTNALSTYSAPSKLIDAATKGREWFAKNADPKMAAKEFKAMSQGEKEAALVGVRDWARTLAGRSDRGIAAERVWSGGDNRARLEAILGPEGYAKLAKAMEIERNAVRTSRDINAGSRTTPMALEAADNNALTTGVLEDLLQGRIFSAGGKFAGNAVDRITTGRNEAVNARIANMLTSTDPAEVGLVNALLERARIEELTRSQGRRNALAIGGGVLPASNALAGERR